MEHQDNGGISFLIMFGLGVLVIASIVGTLISAAAGCQ